MTEKMSRKRLLLAILVSLSMLAGCGGKQGLIGGGGQNGGQLKSIALTPSNPTLALTVSPAPPAAAQFVAIGTFSIGNPQDITKQVTWISADPTVATTDSNGIATAVGSGRTFITAQMQDAVTGKLIQSSTILTVVPQLTSITVSPASAKIAHGTTQQFIATGDYNDKTTSDVSSQVTWNSSQPAAATVSTSPGTQGLATGVAPGSTNITATLGTLSSAPAALTVSNANLVSLAVTPGTPTVPLATTQQLVATGTFDDGTNQNISGTVLWTSSDVSVARASATGSVSGVGVGSATIMAASGGINNTAAVTVDPSSVSAVNVVPVAKIANGTNKQMRAFAVFKDGSSLEVTHTKGVAWSSSNPAAASIGPATGLATTTGPGTATITAMLGKSGNTSLNVSDAAIQALAVAPNGAVIAQGGIQNVVALATFVDNNNSFQQDISSVAAWTSDNTLVATVSYVNGLQELAQGVGSGTANITASFIVPGGGSSATGSGILTVNAATLNGISLTPGSASFPLGGGQQFLATGNFSDGSQQDLTLIAGWGSLDEAVAMVSPFGFAGASGPGQTSVSATFASQQGSGSVLVNPAALARIDICAASVNNPLANCPPLDLFPPPPPITFAMQTPFPLVAIGTFTDGSRQDLTGAVRWSSASPSVATVSNDPGIPGIATGVTRQGVLSGIQAGTSVITAASGGVSGTSKVTVTIGTLQVLTITPMNGSIALGTTQSCTVVGTFSDNSTQDLTPYVQWTTSDPNVVIVNPGGVAYPSGTGTATIKASMNGITGATTLTVQ
jgi:uncharacterized protein YjdB